MLTGKYAKEILIENNRAVGVAYQDTFNRTIPMEKVYADTVIANAAQPNVTQMLPEPQCSALQKRIGELRPACSLLSVYLGFNIDLRDLGVTHYSNVILNKALKSLKEHERAMHTVHGLNGRLHSSITG